MHKYLETGYKSPDKECRVLAFGWEYKVIKLEKVTVFYNASVVARFDVENERLEREYNYFFGDRNAVESESKEPENVPESPETVIDGEYVEVPPEPEFVKPVQPELPILKNNDQRAAFVDAYETWPLWIETKETGERYYRYSLPDDTRMVVKVYHARIFDYKAPGSYEDKFREGWGEEEYYLLREGKFFRNCRTSRPDMIEKLKELQKKGGSGVNLTLNEKSPT